MRKDSSGVAPLKALMLEVPKLTEPLSPEYEPPEK
jgi:hypothetical protein